MFKQLLKSQGNDGHRL